MIEPLAREMIKVRAHKLRAGDGISAAQSAYAQIDIAPCTKRMQKFFDRSVQPRFMRGHELPRQQRDIVGDSHPQGDWRT
jgi:hypothetical protein